MATFRVPLMEQTVAATPERVSSPVLLDVADPGAGVRSLSQGLGAAAAIVEKVQQDVDDTAITEKLVEFDRRAGSKLMGKELGPIDAAFEGASRSTGFLQLRGEAASKASGELMGEVQKDVDELSGALTPRQRKAFLEKVRTLQMGVENKVNAHVVGEVERGVEDSIKALESQIYRNIGDDPTSSLTDPLMVEVEQLKGKRARTPEAREAAIADFRGEVARRQVVSLLKKGRVDEAEARFKETRRWLGDASDDLEDGIAKAKLADGIKKDNIAALEHANKMVLEGTPPNGYAVGTAKSAVLDKLRKVPVDADREKLDSHVMRLLRAEEERFEADRENHRNLALQGDKLSDAPPETTVWLQTYDNGWLKAQREHRAELSRRWLASKRDGATSAEKRAAESLQEDNDKEFKARYKALDPEEQAKKSPEAFAVEYAATVKGRPFAVSPVATAEASEFQRRTIEGMKKGDLSQEAKVRAELNKTLPGVLLITRGKEKGKPRPEVKQVLKSQGRSERDPVAEIVGDAMDEYRRRRAEKGGDLTSDEFEQFIGETKAGAPAKVEGLIFDSKVTVPGSMLFKGNAPAPVPPVPAGSGNQPVAPTKTVTVVNKKTGKRKTMPADQAATLPTDRFEVLP